jgi:hypothetical protein
VTGAAQPGKWACQKKQQVRYSQGPNLGKLRGDFPGFQLLWGKGSRKRVFIDAQQRSNARKLPWTNNSELVAVAQLQAK